MRSREIRLGPSWLCLTFGWWPVGVMFTITLGRLYMEWYAMVNSPLLDMEDNSYVLEEDDPEEGELEEMEYDSKWWEEEDGSVVSVEKYN